MTTLHLSFAQPGTQIHREKPAQRKPDAKLISDSPQAAAINVENVDSYAGQSKANPSDITCHK